MEHIYHLDHFGENWFQKTSQTLIKKVVEITHTGGKFVEIGSWKGKSAAFTVVEIINSGKKIQFDCIDTWEGSKEHQGDPCLSELFEIFQENMKPLEGYYNAVKLRSMDAVKLYEDNSLDFIYIDASHEYEDVKNDILHWRPKLKDTGVISGDDYSWEGVKKAVNEIFEKDVEKIGDTWFHSKINDLL